MRGLAYLLCIILLTSIAICQAFSKDEIVVLNDKVGGTVDIEENLHFRIFPDVDNFLNAQFHHVSDDSIVCIIQTITFSGIDVILRHYSDYDVFQISQSIDEIPELTELERREIQKKFQPLFTNRFLSEVPEGSLCFVEIDDGRIVEGRFHLATAEEIQLWNEGQIFSVPIEVAVEMKYWERYKTYPILNKASYVGVALLGAMTGGLIKAVFKDSDIWFDRFFGASVGIIIGHRYVDKLNNLFIPSKYIEFKQK